MRIPSTPSASPSLTHPTRPNPPPNLNLNLNLNLNPNPNLLPPRRHSWPHLSGRGPRFRGFLRNPGRASQVGARRTPRHRRRGERFAWRSYCAGVNGCRHRRRRLRCSGELELIYGRGTCKKRRVARLVPTRPTRRSPSGISTSSSRRWLIARGARRAAKVSPIAIRRGRRRDGPMGDRLDDSLRGMVLSRCRLVRLLPGEVLVEEGQARRCLFIVGAGRILLGLDAEERRLRGRARPRRFLVRASSSGRRRCPHCCARGRRRCPADGRGSPCSARAHAERATAVRAAGPASAAERSVRAGSASRRAVRVPLPSSSQISSS